MSYSNSLIKPAERNNVNEIAILLASFADSRIKIRTLIVDDMAPARNRIKRCLKSDSAVEIIGECSSGRQAIDAINNLKPDLVFLNIEMPEVNGFEVVKAIDIKPRPAIIFVTAYDHFTLQAFDVQALDYVLKPFNDNRLKRSLERAKRSMSQIKQININEQLQNRLQAVKPAPKFINRIAVKLNERTIFLPTNNIDWMSTAGNYLEIHAGKQKHLIRERMCELEAKLDPTKFVRIHRLSLINIERLKEMQPLFNGDYVVILQNGVQLTLSRTYREKLFALIKGEL